MNIPAALTPLYKHISKTALQSYVLIVLAWETTSHNPLSKVFRDKSRGEPKEIHKCLNNLLYIAKAYNGARTTLWYRNSNGFVGSWGERQRPSATYTLVGRHWVSIIHIAETARILRLIIWIPSVRLFQCNIVQL